MSPVPKWRRDAADTHSLILVIGGHERFGNKGFEAIRESQGILTVFRLIFLQSRTAFPLLFGGITKPPLSQNTPAPSFPLASHCLDCSSLLEMLFSKQPRGAVGMMERRRRANTEGESGAHQESLHIHRKSRIPTGKWENTMHRQFTEHISFPRATITKRHKLVASNNSNVFSHSPGGQKSEGKVSAKPYSVWPLQRKDTSLPFPACGHPRLGWLVVAQLRSSYGIVPGSFPTVYLVCISMSVCNVPLSTRTPVILEESPLP